jgi:hypothetical protein
MQNSALAIILATASLGACATAATADAAVRTETRSVPPFSSIALNGIGTVRVHRGPQKVVVTVDAGLLDRFETMVKADRLMVGFKCGIGTLLAIRTLKSCEVDITVPSLDGIEINGSGTIVADAFSGKDMRIVQNGASTVKCDLTFEKLSLKATGAGTIALAGTASTVELSSTGNETIDARNLVSRVGRVRVTGSGRVGVMVEDELDAAVSGAGEIQYAGSPRVTERVSGAGSIRRLQE